MVKDAYLETRVMTADPVELIHMLYQRALDLIDEARQGLRAGDVAVRATAIAKAVAILGELDGSLNHEVGGDLSRRMASLYQYMQQRLSAANSKQQDAPLAEVEALLTPLAEAWSSIRPAVAPTTPTWPGPFAQASELVTAGQGWMG